MVATSCAVTLAGLAVTLWMAWGSGTPWLYLFGPLLRFCSSGQFGEFSDLLLALFAWLPLLVAGALSCLLCRLAEPLVRDPDDPARYF